MSPDLPAADLKPVTHGDLKAFAKRDCRMCHGVGEFRQVLGERRKDRACGCALRRFLKTNRHRVTVDRNTGAMLWLPESVAEALAEALHRQPPTTP